MVIKLKAPPDQAAFKQFRLSSGTMARPNFAPAGGGITVTVESEADAIELEAEDWIRLPAAVAKRAAPVSSSHPLVKLVERCQSAVDALAAAPVLQKSRGGGYSASAAWRAAADDFERCLEDLRDAVQKIADQPLPMGMSSVSAQFLRPGGTPIDLERAALHAQFSYEQQVQRAAGHLLVSGSDAANNLIALYQTALREVNDNRGARDAAEVFNNLTTKVYATEALGDLTRKVHR